MSTQLLFITREDKRAIDLAEEVLRQIIKGNTSPDGHEARQALYGLQRIYPKFERTSEGPTPPEAA